MLEQLLWLDDSILLAVNGLHNEYFDRFMWLVSDKWVWVPLYFALAYALWRRFGWRGLVVSLLAVGLTFAVTDHFSIQVFRPIFNRLRPTCSDNPISVYVHLVNGYTSGRCGFPSAHAANTVGLAVLMGAVFRRRVLSLFLAGWVMLVCYSRMYLGVHYLGDLLGGVVFGAAVAGVFFWLYHVSLRLHPDDNGHGRMELLPAVVVVCVTLVIAVAAFF
ncbi:MAG: phosphatase PAP2 family protein [Alloprevotella sp.]|nr:phosphatase PAP2 family protein [Alloprevotella sp.]